MHGRARVLAEDRSELGEGAAVDPVTGALRWFDINGRRRVEYDFATGRTSAVDLPEMTSAGAAVDERAEMIFTQTGLWLRRRADGGLEKLVGIEDDRPGMRSNDGRTHPCGAFWCSTMALDKKEGAGAIYWFFKGELRLLYPGLTVGNAICFAADGSYAHFSDTPRGLLWKVATDPATGLPAAEPEVFLRADEGDPSGPDGAVLDGDGLLFSARWGGARVDVIDPAGRTVGAVATGGPNTTCPAFCGPGLSAIAIATARDELDEAQLRRFPDSGRTHFFEAGCRGRLDPPVLLG